MSLIKITLALLAAIALIGAAGCGDDDGDDTSSEETTETTEALSNEEYATEVQDVLLSFGESFSALGTEIQQAKSEEDFSALVGEAESEIQTTIDDFSAITPPEDAQEAHDQILAALEGFAGNLTDVSEAVESGDQTALTDAATELQSAALDFQDELTQAAQSLSEAGIEFEGAPAPTTGG